MLDKNRSRTVIILGLLGVFACIVSLFFLSKHSAIDFKFPLDKDEIINRSDAFLFSNRALPLPLVKKAKVLSNQKATVYLQKKLGIKKAESLLKSLPLYYWQVEYVFPRRGRFIFPSKNISKIVVDPFEAKVMGFSQSIPKGEYENLKILSRNRVEGIANDFFNSIDFDISGFNLVNYLPIEGGNTFEWEKGIAELKAPKLKVKLEILGDQIGSFQYLLDIPEKEFKQFRLNNIINMPIFIILNILVFVLGIYVLIVAIIKRKKVKWRFGIIFATLMAIAFLVNFLRVGYRRDFYLFIFMFVSTIALMVDFIWTFIVSCVARLFAEESDIDMFPVQIHLSILVSYVFFFTSIGLTLLFFTFIVKTFNPISTLGFDSFFSEFPSSKYSCLIPALLSLGAAVFEEVFFRALLMSFLKRYIKKMIWIVVLSSIIWSFMHISPVGFSDIYPGFIKGVILLPVGIFFGYIFIRFGLVCAIVTHYLYDLFVIGMGYSKFSNFNYTEANFVIMLAAAILPLVIALLFKLNRKNA